jgi:hypothetical protein
MVAEVMRFIYFKVNARSQHVDARDGLMIIMPVEAAQFVTVASTSDLGD